MDKQSKHSRVKERINLLTSIMGFVVMLHKFVPVAIELFNMAFNYSIPKAHHDL
ncbi:hypothetical protein K6672_004303 [Vibrio vulnificus]|nr:hypothetical protein [Vibrio vulnificus]EIA1324168.1 hypothetical protein [Vibrio vulnificus]EIU7824668.1 hypothetical protein [Vibrio vulnificus]ELP1870056.1 hypothetical protein [Vibrio vulnificus]ELP5932572.1 hypothetical protein [Vibrio vulnificus]